MRLLAFICFVCAAFAWIPPWLDRAGLAALGFGFLAFTVGSPRQGLLPTLKAAAGYGPGSGAIPSSPDVMAQYQADLRSQGWKVQEVDPS